MGVNIKKNTVNAFHAEMRKRVDLVSFKVLSRAGENAVTFARNLDTYKDQTANLRNSIGYVIVHDGKIVSNLFSGSGDGAAKGQSYAKKIASEAGGLNSKGWILIVVAGMEYAAYVEAKGYDVLSGAGNMLRSYISETIAQIKAELKQ